VNRREFITLLGGAAVLNRARDPRIFGQGAVRSRGAEIARVRFYDLTQIEPPRLKRKNISAAIAADVKRFYQQIKTDDVFGTHTSIEQH
jgi:hypothetical protein